MSGNRLLDRLPSHLRDAALAAGSAIERARGRQGRDSAHDDLLIAICSARQRRRKRRRVRVAVAVALPLVLCLACAGREQSSPAEPKAPSDNLTVDASHGRHPGAKPWSLTIVTPNQATCPRQTETFPIEIVAANGRIALYGLRPMDNWAFAGPRKGNVFKATTDVSQRVEGRFSADGQHLTAKETDPAFNGTCIRNWTAVRQ